MRAFLLILPALASGAEAAAQEVPCDVLDRVVAETPNNFRGLEGRVVDEFEGDYTYEMNVFLPGASRCRIVQVDREAQVECLYRFASAQAAMDGGRQIESWLAKCAGVSSFYDLRTYKGAAGPIFSRHLNGRGDYKLTILPRS